MSGYYLPGEVLELLRGSAGIPVFDWLISRGDNDYPNIEPVGTIDTFSGGFCGSEDNINPVDKPTARVDLHSMAALAIMLYSDETTAEDDGVGVPGGSITSNWMWIREETLNAWFNAEVAASLDPSVPEVFREGYNSGSMLSTIAYSILDEGTRIFGDVAVRTMLDDLQDLSNAVFPGQNSNIPSTNNPFFELSKSGTFGKDLTVRQMLTNMIVQYAGALALYEVEQTNTGSVETAYREDIAIEARDGIIAIEDNGILTIDLSRVLWNDLLEDTPEADRKVKGEVGRNDDGLVGVDPIHRQDLIRLYLSQIEAFSEDGGRDPIEFLNEIARELYRVPDSIRDASAIFDRIHVRMENDNEPVTLTERPYKAFVQDGEHSQVDLFVGRDDIDDEVTGTSGSDLLIGGTGNDTLYGGSGGIDWFVGGSGNDIVSLLIDPRTFEQNNPDEPAEMSFLSFGKELLDQLLQTFSDWWFGDQNAERDTVEITLAGDLPRPIGAKGFSVIDVTLIESLLFRDEIVLLLQHEDSGVGVEARLSGMDVAVLSDRRDRIIVKETQLQAPMVLDLGNFGNADIYKEDFDLLSFEDFTTGIIMLNGVVRSFGENAVVPVYFTQQNVTASLNVSLPTEFQAFEDFEASSPLCFRGFEYLIGTDQSDILWFDKVNKIQKTVENWRTDQTAPMIGKIVTGKGNDAVFFRGALSFSQGEIIVPEGTSFPSLVGPLSVAGADLFLTIQGGEGNDSLVAMNGEHVELRGGEG